MRRNTTTKTECMLFAYSLTIFAKKNGKKLFWSCLHKHMHVVYYFWILFTIFGTVFWNIWVVCVREFSIQIEIKHSHKQKPGAILKTTTKSKRNESTQNLVENYWMQKPKRVKEGKMAGYSNYLSKMR